MKVIVIGGGPAGMMAAIRAAENSAEVVLFVIGSEKNCLSREKVDAI